MTYVTPIKAVLAIAIAVFAMITIIAPDLVLQMMIRGGLVLGGIAITLALRPDDTSCKPLPLARVRSR